MSARRLLEWGGLVAGAVLIVFGVAAIWMGVDGRSTVRDSIKQEQIFFGDTEDPAVAKYASEWAEEQVLTGEQARAFAQVMREHALESAGGLTYAQMGRFQSAANPDDPKGTSDEALAAKDESGAPIANSARNTWVTETALSTALNMSYMAEQLSIFGIVVGVALLLSGIGFIILALVALGGVLGGKAVESATRSSAPAASH
jgi:small-conductance mechanosensitive channel